MTGLALPSAGRGRSLARVLAICALLLPGRALAQAIEMRSGDHDGFTRLVLDIPEGLGWQGVPGTNGTSYRVELARGGFQIRLDGVFRRIGHDRVAEVTALPGGDGVALTLACDCVVESSIHESRMIVLDIRPRREGETLPSAAPVAPQVTEEIPPPPRPVLDLGLLPGPLRDSGARSLLPSFDPGARIAAEAEVAPRQREIADAFGRTLAEQLATGATQGLLDADGPLPPPVTPDANSDRHPAAHGPGDPQPHTPATPLGAELLEGPASRGFGASSMLRIGGQSACLDDSRLDLPGWFGSEGEAGALERLGNLRGKLVGEFDRIDRQAQRDLARLYISLGFGAEARALLQLGQDLPDPVLMTLATLSEGGSDPAGVFAGQSECNGRAALWAVLGAKALPRNAEIAVPALLSAFEELPLGLRRVLGPRLAERLVEERQLDAARNVLSRLARALGGTTEGMQLAAARIARASGDPAEAEALLSGLVAAPGELGVAAAVESIDLATTEGQPVDPGMVDLTAAYSTERRATDEADRLWLAHVRAAWANGEFDRAFAEIAAADVAAPETLLRARAEALRALTASGREGKFLRHALDPQNLALAPADPALALQVGEQFLSLGLPEAAGRWLAGPAPPGREHDWRLLEARKALAQQDPTTAEIALVGLQGDDVLRLRAEAREAMGDYTFARDAYAQLGDAANAARLAWLAGDLEAAAKGDDPLFAQAAALASAAPPALGAPSLSEGKALADSGQSTIESIRALLAGSAPLQP